MDDSDPEFASRYASAGGISLTAWSGIAGLALLVSIAPGAARSAAQATSPWEGRVEVEGGIELWAECAGRGSPGVILEAGARNASATWDPVWTSLTGLTRTCRYDRAGLGRSDSRTSPDESVAAATADLEALVDNLPITGPLVLVGHSVGALYARLYARRHPSRIAGLVFVDGLQERYRSQVLALPPPTDPQSRRAWAGYIGGQRRILTEAGEDAVVAAMREAGDLGDVPLIVLSAGHPIGEPPSGFAAGMIERMTELWREGQAVHLSLSTAARQVVVADAGHDLHRDRPDVVVAAVRELVYGEDPPDVATIVGPLQLSVGNVYRGSFTPDGMTLLFFKKVGDDPNAETYRIFQSHRTGTGWSRPQLLNLGGEFSDLYPAVSPDGTHLAFSSYRPPPGDAAGHVSASLWSAPWLGDRWGTPVHMEAPSIPGHYHSHLIFDREGVLHFKVETSDYREPREMSTRWNGTRYTAPIQKRVLDDLGAEMPSHRVFETTPAPDGSFVILTVGALDPDTGRPGPPDLWASVRNDGGWSAPRPLKAGVNSDGAELFPFFHPGGKELWFVRDFASFFRVDLNAALERGR